VTCYAPMYVHLTWYCNRTTTNLRRKLNELKWNKWDFILVLSWCLQLIQTPSYRTWTNAIVLNTTYDLR